MLLACSCSELRVSSGVASIVENVEAVEDGLCSGIAPLQPHGLDQSPSRDDMEPHCRLAIERKSLVAGQMVDWSL